MSTNELKPKPNRRRTLILAAIALFFACGICGVIVTLIPDSDTPTAPAATTEPLPDSQTEPPPTNTAESIPTDTAEPPPTATSEPAPTDPPPPPTTAPTEAPAGESADSLVYTASILEIAELYRTGLEGLGTQSSAVGATPTLILDDEWKITTATYLAAIRVANDQVRSLNPPEQFRAVHDELLTAAGHFETMTTLYAEGVDEISADKLAGALESMQLGSSSIRRATGLMDTLNSP